MGSRDILRPLPLPLPSDPLQEAAYGGLRDGSGSWAQTKMAKAASRRGERITTTATAVARPRPSRLLLAHTSRLTRSTSLLYKIHCYLRSPFSLSHLLL